MKRQAYLLLGSNMGDRAHFIRSATEGLSALGVITRESGMYKTEPWKMDTEDWFYNKVIALTTSRSPEELLEQILRIEQQLGRERDNALNTGYTSRIIDIDILYVDDVILDSPTLQLPHPHIQDRRFALAPMVEVAPNFLHPVLGLSQSELLEICPDPSFLELV